MGIQGRHGDAGLVAQALSGDLAQLDGLPEGSLGEVGADLADGDVAGGPDGHEIVHHVDLTEGGGEVEGVGQVCMLALVVEPRHLHGPLVEGPEDKALDLPGLAELNSGVQLLEVAGPAVGVGLAVGHLGGVLVLQVQHGEALGPVAFAEVADHVVGHAAAHHLQAVLEHAQVSDDDGAAVVLVVIPQGQHSHQLRANAGGVSQKDAEDRLFTHKSYLHKSSLYPRNPTDFRELASALYLASYVPKQRTFRFPPGIPPLFVNYV